MERQVQVPSQTALFGNGSVVELRHNVADLVSVPQQQVAKINAHYGPRAFHQLMATRAGDSAAVPTSAESMRRVLPLLQWGKKHLGVHYVLVSDDAERTPFAHDPVVVPYFSSKNFGERKLWGLGPEEAAMLKDKTSFADTVQGLRSETEPVSEEYGVHPTTVLPYEAVECAEDVVEAVRNRLQASVEMYAAFKAYDSELNYPLGVVIQQSGGDGGYGTTILRQGDHDTSEVLSDKKAIQFVGYDEAEAYMSRLVHEAGSNFKITRYVDLAASPSIGTYVHGDEVMPMPMTMQFIENGSCIGGSSQNAVEQGVDNVVQAYEPYLQKLSRTIVHATVPRTVASAHVGMDYMIAGEQERRLLAVLKDGHSDIARYAEECIEVGIAESNPRMTSLSLSVWPLLLYDNRQSGRDPNDITYEDIRTFYGMQRSDGCTGGFAVWDYLDAPDGITTTYDLLSWIDETNVNLQAADMFIVPRLPIESGDNRMVTSVVLGMRPNSSHESAALFRSITQDVSSSCSLNVLNNV